MRQLNRAELGTYTQFIFSRGHVPSELTIDDTIDLAYDMQWWLHNHFERYTTLHLAMGLLATKNGGNSNA